jgi:hypothetical protein
MNLNYWKTTRDADYRRAVEAAAKGGARIECIALDEPKGNRWTLVTWESVWNWSQMDYRVAPEEPAKPREWWISPGRSGVYEVYDTQNEAQCNSWGPNIHVREIIE